MIRTKSQSAIKRQEQLSARAEAMDKIEALLLKERRTAPELSNAIEVNPNTLNGYLRHMQRSLRKIRPTSLTRARSTLWELGADPSLPTPDEELDQAIATKRGWRKAVQIGMKRDPLIEAFFGPANQEYKETA